jgi:hypothetical protein
MAMERGSQTSPFSVYEGISWDSIEGANDQRGAIR